MLRYTTNSQMVISSTNVKQHHWFKDVEGLGTFYLTSAHHEQDTRICDPVELIVIEVIHPEVRRHSRDQPKAIQMTIH